MIPNQATSLTRLLLVAQVKQSLLLLILKISVCLCWLQIFGLEFTVLLKCSGLSRLSPTTELICDFGMQMCILRARLVQRPVPPLSRDTEGVSSVG